MGASFPVDSEELIPGFIAPPGSPARAVAMLAVPVAQEASDMDPIEAARARLDQAAGVAAILDAAYEAFEEMLRAIEDQQDPGGGAFAAFVMSGAAPANARRAPAPAPPL